MTHDILVSWFRNGQPVYLDDKGFQHMLAHRDVYNELPEAIERMHEPEGDFWVGEVEFNRFIGLNQLVPWPTGTLLFTQRTGRKNFTRVVFDAEPLPTTTMVVLVHKRDDVWFLGTAWFGKLGKKEPTDKFIKPEEMEASLDFWSNNALIYNPDWPLPVSMTWDQAIAASREAEEK